MSQFKFLSFVPIWVFKFCHNLSFVTIWDIQFLLLLHNLSFVTIWVLLQFEFLSFVTIGVFEFCQRDTRFYPLFVQRWFVGNAKQTNTVFFRNIWCLVIGSSQSPALFGLGSHCWYVYSLSKQLVEERSSSFFVFINNLEISKSETSSRS